MWETVARTRIFIWIVILVCGCSGQSHNPPASNFCPGVLQYVYDNGQYKGLISIQPPVRFSSVSVRINMTTDYSPQNYGIGSISVQGGSNQIQEISDRVTHSEIQVIHFLVSFPLNQPIPKIISVNINGQEFCSGQIPGYRYKGLVNLEYSLSTGVLNAPYVQGNQFIPGVQQGNGGNSIQRPYVPQQTEQPVYQQPVYQQPQQPVYQQSQKPVYQQPQKPVYQQPQQPVYQQPQQPIRIPASESSDKVNVDNSQCGIPAKRAFDANQLIIEGQHTERKQWPWMVALFAFNGGNVKQFRCGGTLVSKMHVITAAHCVYEKSMKRAIPVSMIVTELGKHDLSAFSDRNVQIINVKKIHIHEQYASSEIFDFDLAILVLAKPARIDEYVRPACIWDSSLPSDLLNIVSKRGAVLGWGRDQNGSYGKALMLANMKVVTQEACKKIDEQFYQEFTSEYTYCAGYNNGTNVCNGDSGGGMYFNFENEKQDGKKTWFVRGVVSRSKYSDKSDSEHQCDDQSYAIFTDLAQLTSWILDTIRGK